MKPELAQKLIDRFPWIKPNDFDEDSPWKRYTFQCSDGWFQFYWDMFT